MGKISINIATGSLQKEDQIVGIDLGTTNSLIAIMHPDTNKPVVLKEFDNTTLVPSIVHFGGGGQVSVGNEAKNFLITEPENTIFSVKRLMGKSYADVAGEQTHFSYNIFDNGKEEMVKVAVGDKFYSPVELSSMILKALKDRAEHILKTSVSRAVITVPAYFNDNQRQATRDAGKLAGLDVLRIVNEPTAASLAYGIGMQAGEEKTVAVYDFGGGTFDISVLRISNGMFEVLATNGDTYLGGDDFDKAIVDHWTRHHALESRQQSDKSFAQQLRLTAEEAKICLTDSDDFKKQTGDVELKLDRKKLDELIAPFIERTLKSCRQVMADAGLTIEEIDEVVLVGGTTRTPLVKKTVGEFFKRKPHDELNPDEVVALGAAIQADILSGNNKDLLLLDVTPLSLGIETMGGLMDVLIPRNSKIPSKAGRQYTTQKDGQGSMRISVYQGERDMVKDNRKLASFNLTGIPGMPAGMAKVEVSFLINADGILVVKAKELRSGVEQSIEVKPQYGLTDEEVENMLLASIQHAKDDMQLRALVEAQTEAKVMLETTRNFLVKHKQSLAEEEIRTTNEAVIKLEDLVNTGNKDEIHAAIEALNNISRPYAERVMDEAISQAMKGKKI
jgi:molecular chaperone HscA